MKNCYDEFGSNALTKSISKDIASLISIKLLKNQHIRTRTSVFSTFKYKNMELIALNQLVDNFNSNIALYYIELHIRDFEEHNKDRLDYPGFLFHHANCLLELQSGGKNSLNWFDVSDKFKYICESSLSLTEHINLLNTTPSIHRYLNRIPA